MTSNTGLLTARCDPYGAESQIKLFGGLYPESMNGKHHWFCENSAVGRFRMVCTGGTYGHKLANDGGSVQPHHCDGGHKGQVMPLCADHRIEIQRRQAGVCPRCAMGAGNEEVLGTMQRIESLQQELQSYYNFGLLIQVMQIQSRIEAEGHRMTEFYEQGITHRCPLQLVEVP